MVRYQTVAIMKPSAFFRTLCVFMCSGLMSLGLCDLMMKHFISSSFSQSESVFFNLQLDVFLFFVSVLLTEVKTFRLQTSGVLTEFIECVCYQLQLAETLTLIKLYFL